MPSKDQSPQPDKKSEIKRKYDETSRFYDRRYAKIQEEKFKKIFENADVLNNIILDAGAGTGLLFEYITNNFPLPELAGVKYVATDISGEMLRVFKQKTEERPISEGVCLDFIESDLEHLPLRNDIFSSTFAITSLQNLSNYRKGLEESVRVGKSGSEIVISILKKNLDLENFLSKLEEYSSIQRVIDDERLEDVIILSCLKAH